MIAMKARGHARAVTGTMVARVTRTEGERGTALLWQDEEYPSGEPPLCILTTRKELRGKHANTAAIYNMNRLDHLEAGDIVAIHQSGLVTTLFRTASLHNSLFITDRCNSNCLMCSQPPRNQDDLDALFDLNAHLIPLIPQDTRELGITGGEPTLLGKRLPQLIAMAKAALPQTALHLLTNGRSFAWPQVAEAFASVDHPDLVYGVPLYSDYYAQHDYIVQARDAFSQTLTGLHNLARLGQRIEIRVVLHRQSIARLPQLARFIYKNLPFTEHIAFMGLEYTGYTPHNDGLLFMEPETYMLQLEEAVTYLAEMGLCVSIYNLPLCLVPAHLREFCCRSISDWKQGYLAECNACAALDQCGGVFLTSKKHSQRIRAIGVGEGQMVGLLKQFGV